MNNGVERSTGLPPRWNAARIKDIAQVNPRLDKNGLRDDLVVSFVPMRAVEEESGRMDVSSTRPLADVKKGYTPFCAGDVIMAKITPCMENGKIAVVPEVTGGLGFGSTEFHVLRPYDGVAPNWLFFYLLQHSYRRDARLHMAGSAGQLRVPSEFLANSELPVAPAAEQHRIVAEIEKQFSRLDAGVAALKRVEANLKRYRAAVLKAACTGTLTADWRAAHPDVEPASKLLDRILKERRHRWEEAEFAKMTAKGKTPKDDRWKGKYKEPARPSVPCPFDLPPGWAWVTWEQIGFSQNGRAFPSKEYQNTGTKLLRPGNLHASGEVRWTQANTRCLPESWVAEYPEYLVGPDELVMNLTAQSLKDDFLGRVCMTGAGERCLLNQRIARLAPVALPSLFFLWLFKSRVFRSFVRGLNTGSLIQHMFTSQLREFSFAVPPLPEQHEIVKIVEAAVSSIRATEASVEKQKQRSERLRQSILKTAFEGKLVEQDATDEPATELLARIRAKREKQTDAAAPGRGPKVPRGRKTAKKRHRRTKT